MKEAMTAAYTAPLSRPASSTAITARTPGQEGQSKGSRPSSAKAKGTYLWLLSNLIDCIYINAII